MKIRNLMLSFAALVFTFIGTAGGITPMCAGYFYEPKKPEILK